MYLNLNNMTDFLNDCKTNKLREVKMAHSEVQINHNGMDQRVVSLVLTAAIKKKSKDKEIEYVARHIINVGSFLSFVEEDKNRIMAELEKRKSEVINIVTQSGLDVMPGVWSTE